jgi:hypothetical protein
MQKLKLQLNSRTMVMIKTIIKIKIKNKLTIVCLIQVVADAVCLVFAVHVGVARNHCNFGNKKSSALYHERLIHIWFFLSKLSLLRSVKFQ